VGSFELDESTHPGADVIKKYPLHLIGSCLFWLSISFRLYWFSAGSGPEKTSSYLVHSQQCLGVQVVSCGRGESTTEAEAVCAAFETDVVRLVSVSS
jgi:hypothetical protein